MDSVVVDTTNNAKILAVRNYTGKDHRNSGPLGVGVGCFGSGTEPEFAEQLNADVSRKYVKGMFTSRA